MTDWKVVTFILCAYGFFKEIKPSEPYLTPYLRQWKNLTSEEVNNQIYPVWTYSYLAALFVVFLVTDLLRYKPVIVFEALCYIATWLLLLFTRGVLPMQMMQFCFGLVTATEVAYYAYIYAVVAPTHFRRVAGLTRGVVLCGRFFAYLASQFLVSFSVLNYLELNYISLASVSVAFLVSLALPSVKHSAYFHRGTEKVSTEAEEGEDNAGYTEDVEEGSTRHATNPGHITHFVEMQVTSFPAGDAAPDTADIPDGGLDVTKDTGRGSSSEGSDTGATLGKMPECPGSTASANDFTVTKVDSFGKNSRVGAVLLLMWREFRAIYTDRSLLMWSVWWALASCGNFQVANYVQNLWDVISPGRESSQTYNGVVEAVAGVLGTVLALGVGWVTVDWDRHGELLLGTVSAANSVLLCLMATATNIWLVYSLYVVFRASFQMVITVATFQIAARLSTQSYGLAFGFNTFMSLALETLLTVIVVDKRGLNAPVTTQFLVYGGYFGLMGLLFLAKTVYNCLQGRHALPLGGAVN